MDSMGCEAVIYRGALDTADVKRGRKADSIGPATVPIAAFGSGQTHRLPTLRSLRT